MPEHLEKSSEKAAVKTKTAVSLEDPMRNGVQELVAVPAEHHHFCYSFRKVLAMAGSKGGKHAKRKGKSKSTKSNEFSKKSESSRSELDLAQVSNTNVDGTEDFKEENPQLNMNSSKDTGLSNLTEDKLVEYLYIKLKELYSNAKCFLESSGYSERDVERAILRNGYLHGPEGDLLNNILINSIAFLENPHYPKRHGFKDKDDLYQTMLETLVDFAVKSLPYIPKEDAMKQLLVKSWGSVPSITVTSYLQSKNENRMINFVYDSIKVLYPNKSVVERLDMMPSFGSKLKNSVPILAASVIHETGAQISEQQAVSSNIGNLKEGYDVMDLQDCIAGLIKSDPTDPKVAIIVDLLVKIQDLQEEVDVRKVWALQKMADAAKRVSEDLTELRMLREKKFDKMQMQVDEKTHKKSCLTKIMEMGQSLQSVKQKAKLIVETVRRLETENAEIRADIEGFKLSAAESERELKATLKRERKWLKKCNENERHRSHLQSQCDEEKQRVEDMQHALLQVEKEAEEVEMQWKEARREKEQLFGFLAEETKKLETQKATNKAKLTKLRQEIEYASQLVMDEQRRLEEEHSSLMLTHQMSKVSMKDEEWYDSPEAIAFVARLTESSQESSSFRERNCMICSENEVSVVFLPCTHQVVCFPCCEGNGIVVGRQCPYCQVKIEESIKVYGPGS